MSEGGHSVTWQLTSAARTPKLRGTVPRVAHTSRFFAMCAGYSVFRTLRSRPARFTTALPFIIYNYSEGKARGKRFSSGRW